MEVDPLHSGVLAQIDEVDPGHLTAPLRVESLKECARAAADVQHAIRRVESPAACNDR